MRLGRYNRTPPPPEDAWREPSSATAARMRRATPGACASRSSASWAPRACSATWTRCVPVRISCRPSRRAWPTARSCSRSSGANGPARATSTGSRRLDEPFDFVRLEIAAALARPNVLVVPVLVEGASMPASQRAAREPQAAGPPARGVGARRDLGRRRRSARERRRVGDEHARSVARRRADLGGPAVGRPAALAVVIVGLLVFNGRRPKPDDGTASPQTGVVGASRGSVEPPAASHGSGWRADLHRRRIAVHDRHPAHRRGGLRRCHLRSGVGQRRDARRRARAAAPHSGDEFGPLRRQFLGRLVPARGRRRRAQPHERPQQPSAPGNSLRYGIVTFRLRPQTRSGILRIVNNQETAEIPLDLVADRPPAGGRAGRDRRLAGPGHPGGRRPRSGRRCSTRATCR